MKKRLQTLGLAVLICFSFILTEKTSTIIKDNDEIMASVKEHKIEFEYASINAKIVNDEVIPGVSGRLVDIEESYQAMKKVGMYKNNLIVYKEVTPTISLTDNYDKYVISGNANKKQVAIIFKVKDDDNINSIITALNNKEILANFFVTYDWSQKNIEVIKNISAQGHNLGKLEYKEQTNSLLQSIIKINTNQKSHYCYSEEKIKKIIDNCSKAKEYTILPSIIINETLLSTVMKEIKSGSIIAINVNKNTIKELSNTLDYIISKGYKIVSLDNLLAE